jgi:hypothetical protein
MVWLWGNLHAQIVLEFCGGSDWFEYGAYLGSRKTPGQGMVFSKEFMDRTKENAGLFTGPWLFDSPPKLGGGLNLYSIRN